MEANSIDILCIQETHTQGSEHYVTETGALVILSGSKDDRHAGVGFIISAALRSAIYNFDCNSARMAAIKIRVPGGKIAIISAYAPQSMISADRRLLFFTDLEVYYNSISVNGMKLLCGDFNPRLRYQFPGEEEIMGMHFFRVWQRCRRQILIGIFLPSYVIRSNAC